jgi:phage shock protein PspC (stress-responsive transcriptional regulator)
MKKTISINISGILFHIEDDGYASLKKYLDAINQHFSLYEDNQEIITDIENRIAEIFLSNLKNNKQVITAENVSNLIEKMGTIADFKAVEEEMEQEEQPGEEENDFYKYITPPEQHAGKGYKKLTRLAHTKILGGVCSGFAHYLSIDPLWTRLITILLLFSGGLNFKVFPLPIFGGDFHLQTAIGWWTVLAYILLWVILPVSYDKPEDKNIKKLYRNPDDRVLGGVGSGMAAYFNIDVIWIRLAFVGLTFAGGSGVVLYLILWIITPMAKSITERIEMKGGAITLSNIETTIQQNLSSERIKEESTGKKIVLAPFRFLGIVINGIGKALGPFGRFLLEVVRVVFGLIIFFIGMMVMIIPLVFLGVYSEILTNNSWGYILDTVPIEALTELLPVWLAIAASIIVLIPGIVLVLLGISVLIKRNLIDGRFGLIVFGIWILSILICSFQIPKIIGQFKSTATHTVETPITPSEGTLIISSPTSRLEVGNFGSVSLSLRGHEGAGILLVQDYKSKGINREDALINASSVAYEFEVQDSVLLFHPNLEFTDPAKYRAQQLSQELRIPFNKPFVLDRSIIPLLRNTINKEGYKSRDINRRNHWVFNENGLLCLNCINDHKQSPLDSLSRNQFKNSYFME